MKKEEYIKAGCNLSIAIVLVGIVMYTFAASRGLVIASFAVMFFGLAIGIPFGFAAEKLKPIPRKERRPMWERLDQRDLKQGKFNYLYNPEYRFLEYLSDHNAKLQDLVVCLDSTSHSEQLFKEIYMSYLYSAKGSKVQSVEQIQTMILHERKRIGAKK